MKVDPELLQVGDVVYMTQRVGVGNTTQRTSVIYDVKILAIHRYGDSAVEWLRGKVSKADTRWNGCNEKTFHRDDLRKFSATRPKPVFHPFWEQTEEQYKRDVEDAKAQAKIESKVWRERAIAARASK